MMPLIEQDQDLTVVVGGQAGSEGKGAVCSALHRERNYDLAIRVGGPNAGHTVVGDNNKKYALRQLPVAAVADPTCALWIAPGSEVDPNVLRNEVGMLEADGFNVRERLRVSPEATIIEPEHLEAERSIRNGTTGKGIGAARAARALRQARRVTDHPLLNLEFQIGSWTGGAPNTMLEGTQGFVLGTREGYYPYCTSGNCRAIDMMAMAGLPPTPPEVVVVLRPHPIRIAGDSGELVGETSWGNLGLEEERTTVTNKVRRVGRWNPDWAKRAVEVNSSRYNQARVALTFLDYIWPGLKGEHRKHLGEFAQVREHVHSVENQVDASVIFGGTGPDTWLQG